MKIGNHNMIVEESVHGMYHLICTDCRKSCNPTKVKEAEEWLKKSPCYHPEDWNKEGAD